VTVPFKSAAQKDRFLSALRATSTIHVLGGKPKKPKELEVPQALIYLRDKLEIHPVDFYGAVPIKADLTSVVDRFLYWLLSEELKAYDVCKPVAELYRRRLAGDEPSQKEWMAAAAAAAAAAWAAAAWAAEAAAAAVAAYERMRVELFRLLRDTAPRLLEVQHRRKSDVIVPK
jgi:hypothetical protein